MRGIGFGVLAAVVAGVVLGAVSRGLMALVTLAGGGSPSFSWSGTVFILLLYVAVAVPGGLVAGLTTSRLRWLLPVAGALFLCVPAVGVAGEEIGSTVGFGAAQWLGTAAAGAAVFATIALLPLLTVRLADAWLGRRGTTTPAPQPVG
ncbi:hypothetical protein ACI784_10910 [Geodermatophilus sp. SYSU D01186]